MKGSGVGRFLAFLLAAGLIVGALAYRNGWSLDGDGGVSTAIPRLVCVTEFADACRSLPSEGKNAVDVTIEPAATTLQRLSVAPDAKSAAVDGWIAPRSWIDTLADNRNRASLPAITTKIGSPLRQEPLVLVGETTRLNVLKNSCGGEISWRCLGDAMGKRQWSALPGGDSQWGALKVGWSDPGSTAAGLQTLNAHTVGFFGRADFDNLDVDGNDYGVWINAATRALNRQSGDPVNTLLTAGPATYGWVISPNEHVAPLLSNAARRSEFQLIQPVPMASLDATFAGVGKSSALEKRVATLQQSGAKADPGSSVTSGVQQHLRSKWNEELSK